MTVASHERRQTLNRMAAFLLIVAMALFTLWRFPPEIYHFYPVCPIHEYLHLDCPGCGATRAISALLHGHFVQALRLNALAVVTVFPLGAFYVAIAFRKAIRGETFRWPVVSSHVTYVALGVAAVFTVIRNL